MVTDKSRTVLPRMRILPPPHAFKVFFSCLRGNSSPIQIAASQRQVNNIKRNSLRVSSPDSDIISFLQEGSATGRRVIFIHGTPGSATGWADYLLNTPSNRMHTAIDRLGYGLSTPEGAVVSLKRQAQAIAPLLEVINNRKSILVGHSAGAPVALQAALDYPETVGGVLLLAGAVAPELEEVNIIQPLGTFKLVSRLLPRNINNANQELLGLKGELVAQSARLHLITIPVSVVHGDHDPLVPVGNVDYLERKLENTFLDKEILTGADHFIPWTFKPSIDRALERLIDRVRQKEQNPQYQTSALNKTCPPEDS